VPSTLLALRLARALGTTVEALFDAVPPAGFPVLVAPSLPGGGRSAGHGVQRAVVATVRGTLVAHWVQGVATTPADGTLELGDPIGHSSGFTALFHPFRDDAPGTDRALVAGCAPTLDLLARRAGGRFGDAKASWITATSGRSLDLLADGLVHVAGFHRPDPGSGESSASIVAARFPGQRMLLAHLTRWRQGFVVPEGNPLGIRSASDLGRAGLRFAQREEGAEAHRLTRRLLEEEGSADLRLSGPVADGHEDVARLVRYGAADVGVAIESVALAQNLMFIPIVEERFDLVVPHDLADFGPVRRLLETLDSAAYRAELRCFPGYDVGSSGHVTTVDGA